MGRGATSTATAGSAAALGDSAAASAAGAQDGALGCPAAASAAGALGDSAAASAAGVQEGAFGDPAAASAAGALGDCGCFGRRCSGRCSWRPSGCLGRRCSGRGCGCFGRFTPLSDGVACSSKLTMSRLSLRFRRISASYSIVFCFCCLDFGGFSLRSRRIMGLCFFVEPRSTHDALCDVSNKQGAHRCV